MNDLVRLREHAPGALGVLSEIISQTEQAVGKVRQTSCLDQTFPTEAGTLVISGGSYTYQELTSRGIDWCRTVGITVELDGSDIDGRTAPTVTYSLAGDGSHEPVIGDGRAFDLSNPDHSVATRRGTVRCFRVETTDSPGLTRQGLFEKGELDTLSEAQITSRLDRFKAAAAAVVGLIKQDAVSRCDCSIEPFRLVVSPVTWGV